MSELINDYFAGGSDHETVTTALQLPQSKFGMESGWRSSHEMALGAAVTEPTGRPLLRAAGRHWSGRA
jgi:hypothetical protein